MCCSRALGPALSRCNLVGALERHVEVIGEASVSVDRRLLPAPRTIKPNADSAWFVVIAFRVSKPGNVELPLVRIDYTTNGHAGWQFQNPSTQMKISG
jgi:hypothetical protein